MTYIIVSNHSAQELVEEVNEWMEKGFTPLGGVSCTANTLFQAMVKLSNR